MRENVISALAYASESCLLLIETPAGQGQKKSLIEGEILSDFNDMIEFYRSIPEKQRSRLGICVDTCHVFAAGYNPIKYLQGMEAAIPGAIKFVHFNDSKGPRYCKVDRHYRPGGGFACVKKRRLKACCLKFLLVAWE